MWFHQKQNMQYMFTSSELTVTIWRTLAIGTRHYDLSSFCLCRSARQWDRDKRRCRAAAAPPKRRRTMVRRMSNRLWNENSLYLLAHAGNPVDWHPWDAESLELAAHDEKPIFLSIGYSACHWCHVMAHESFQDAQIARQLNENFVCIKVDREERPDVDQIYMEAVQCMTGSGGWPLSVFLTPEGKPFVGGTYWPPSRRGNMPGFDEVLAAVVTAWQKNRQGVLQQARWVTDTLTADSWPAPTGELSDKPLQAAEEALENAFDSRRGGFGAAPKFPQPIMLCLLLRRFKQSGKDALLDMVNTTLEYMARVESTTTSAAASTATASIPAGSSHISKKCSTTTPCWPVATWKHGRPPASRYMSA